MEHILVDLILDRERDCARKARHATIAVLPEGEYRDLIEVIASELVTNAYVHGVSPISLTLTRRGATLKLTVVNDSAGSHPLLGEDTPLESEHGRGLSLVQTLSTNWGFSAEGDTITAWAELLSPPA